MRNTNILATETKNLQVTRMSFPVTGMTCAACASSVESMLTHTDGVIQARVNFASSSVWVEYENRITPHDLRQALQSVGYDLIIEVENPGEVQRELQQKHYEEIKKRTIWSAILTFPVFIIGMFYMDWLPGPWVSLIFTIPVLFWFGRSFFIQAFKQAKHGKANMDTLVALSTGVAFLFSLFNTLFHDFWAARGIPPHVYYEAATVIITFNYFGKVLEERAKANNSSPLKKLLRLQPTTLKAVL